MRRYRSLANVNLKGKKWYRPGCGCCTFENFCDILLSKQAWKEARQEIKEYT